MIELYIFNVICYLFVAHAESKKIEDAYKDECRYSKSF